MRVRIRTQNVSRFLKSKGHTLVFPDRRRAGMSARQLGDYEVWVSISYDKDNPEMPAIVADVVSTLHEGGYITRVAHQNLNHAAIIVTRPEVTS